MIDIHAHILPGVDDGAEDLLDALLMAELAVESGVETIIATSHGNLPWENEDHLLEDILKSYQLLRKTLDEKKIPLNLLLGMEIFATEDMADKIKQGNLISMNQTRYYLIEFDFDEKADWCTERLQEVLELGGIPIVAHPERYTCVQKNLDLVREWTTMGCQMQINKGSVFGRFGRRAAEASIKLLEGNLVTYAASDAHSPYHRTTYMRELKELLSEEYSEQLAIRLLEKNAERYLLSKTDYHE